MTQSIRIPITAAEKAELWLRWKRGESLSEIGRAFKRHAATIFAIVRTQGGYYPYQRKRNARHLSLHEREEISRGLACHLSIRSIAKKLGRAASTISREINRNKGCQTYRASIAEKQFLKNLARPKLCKLANSVKLRKAVTRKLMRDWSPEQISGWLRREYSGDLTMQISHETIYRSLFIQARGVLKKELQKHLRSGQVIRRAKAASGKKQSRGIIKGAVSIHDRPASIEDRAVPGHWEGDLISGSKNSHIATLVERHSRYTVLVKVKGKDTISVVSAITEQMGQLPSELQRTLTWDRGMELANHHQFTVDTNIDVFFCDPQSPWQRGTNENTNSLLRQYLPKKTDLSIHSQTELNKIAQKLNSRPRKTLKFVTPAEKLNESVAMNH